MCFSISNLLFHLKQGGKNKVAREIADYLLECVKDANPPTTGNVMISFCLASISPHFNKSSPDYLQKNFEYVKKKHQFNTRSAINGNLSMPKLSTKTGQRSFLYRGVQAWNSLSVVYPVRSNCKLESLA